MNILIKRNQLYSLSIYEVIDSQKCAYLNTSKVFFLKILRQSGLWWKLCLLFSTFISQKSQLFLFLLFILLHFVEIKCFLLLSCLKAVFFSFYDFFLAHVTSRFLLIFKYHFWSSCQTSKQIKTSGKKYIRYNICLDCKASHCKHYTFAFKIH